MKIIQAIVGIALLSAAFGLAYLSKNNAEHLINNKNKIVTQYITQSNKALEEQDLKGAIKFAKFAIVADPKNKAGFKALESIYKVKYKPTEDNTAQETTPSKQTQQSPASQEEEEEDVDMGC